MYYKITSGHETSPLFVRSPLFGVSVKREFTCIYVHMCVCLCVFTHRFEAISVLCTFGYVILLCVYSYVCLFAVA